MTMMESSTPSLRLLVHTAGTDLRFHHLTVLPRHPLRGEEDVRRLYDELEPEVQRMGIHVLQEKVYSEPEAGSSVAAARSEVLGRHEADTDLPYTLVGCSPCQGGAIAGVQICGVSGPRVTASACRTLSHGGAPVGRLLETGGYRMAFLSDVVGAGPGGELAPDATTQCERMFRRAGRLVEDLGFGFRDVARTWIYVHRLLDWYGELNRVRTEAYTRFGVFDPDRPSSLPASTGIQAAHPHGAECFMDLIMATGPDSEPLLGSMRSGQLCEAPSYGSAFSRGKKVHFAKETILFLSGTASIDQQGRTAHVGNAEGQIKKTFDAVREMLAAEGADIGDIATSVMYFKNQGVYECWQHLLRRQEVPAVPAIPVYGDICRDDLLFELEPTAMPGGSSG